MDQRDTNPGGYIPLQQPAPEQPKKKHTALGCGCLSLVAIIVIVFLVVAVNTGNKALSGTPADTATATAAANTQPAESPVATVAAAPATTAAPTQTVVLTKSGNGIGDIQQFTVGDNWALQYSFDCSNAGGQGNFQVYEDYPNGSILANQLAAKGSDTSYQTADAGTHTLKVNSECSWTIKVIDGGTGQ
jgi:cytoskeletal protein RodZ